MIHKEFTFTINRFELFGQYFQPTEVKAIVLLVHGMGEHSRRYENYVIPKLMENSIAIITYDQFGHGKTTGKRGHNPGFESLLDCIEVLLEKSEELFKGIPKFLYGHSMGGNLVINYSLRRVNKLSGIIVTSPFIKLAFDPPSWKLKMGKILQHFLPFVTMDSELEIEAISRDKNEVEKFKLDPMIHSKVSPNYSIAILDSGEWALENASKIKNEMLIMHGTADRITSHKASIDFANNSGNKASLKLFEGAYHELHNELNKLDVLNHINEWINKILINNNKSLD